MSLQSAYAKYGSLSRELYKDEKKTKNILAGFDVAKEVVGMVGDYKQAQDTKFEGSQESIDLLQQYEYLKPENINKGILGNVKDVTFGGKTYTREELSKLGAHEPGFSSLSEKDIKHRIKSFSNIYGTKIEKPKSVSSYKPTLNPSSDKKPDFSKNQRSYTEFIAGKEPYTNVWGGPDDVKPKLVPGGNLKEQMSQSDVHSFIHTINPETFTNPNLYGQHNLSKDQFDALFSYYKIENGQFVTKDVK